MKTPGFINHRRDRTLVFLFCIIAAVAIVYWNMRNAEFLYWDDGGLVYENPYYAKSDWSSLLYFWQHPYISLYMPMTYSLWGAIAILTHSVGPSGEIGLYSSVFHTVSLLIHTANSLLVFVLLRKLLNAPLVFANTTLRAGAANERVTDVAALMGALLFALHPIQVESAAWISELKGVLATFFCLLTFILFCAFLDRTRSSSEPRATELRSGNKLYVGATLCFLGALLSKPNVVGVPLISLVFMCLLWGAPLKRALRVLWPWFVMSLVMSVAMTRMQTSGNLVEETSLGLRFLVASDALGFYVSKLFYPVNFTINYGRTPFWLSQQPWAPFTLLVPLTLAFICWRFKTKRFLLLGVAWCVIALAPNLGFAPFLFQAYSTVADRYFYLAMVGPSLILSSAIVIMFSNWPRQRAVFAWGSCGLMICLLGVLAQRQTRVWFDNMTLYTYAVQANPLDWGSYNNLSVTFAAQKDYRNAIPMVRRSLEIEPKGSPAHLSLANALRSLKKPEEALKSYRLALKHNPQFSEARFGMATLLNDLGRKDEALKEFDKLTKRKKYAAVAGVFAGLILKEKGNFPEAERYARIALDSDDEYSIAHLLLGEIYLQRQLKRDAMREYGRALELDPASAQARVHIAQLMMDGGLREQAIGILKEGLALTPGDAGLQRELKRINEN